MVEFETLQSEEIEFGDGEFIEVARKKAISDEGENEFIALSRGYFTDDGSRRYKANFSVPTDGDVIDFILDQLPALLDNE